MQILIVDDEIAARAALVSLLKIDHEVTECADGSEALKILEKSAVDLVITDQKMPLVSGLELIKRGRELSPTTAFILVTAYGSVDQAVEAIRSGADDYLLKPIDFSDLEHRIKRVEDLRSWKMENTLKVQSGRGMSRLIGKSACIESAKEFVAKVATVASPVLLLGPSGSGKEIIAKSIHEAGPRADRPFVAINCASLSEQLMESELFGHEKGAFTGATAAKPGKFELAKGGTIFLDEVGELSPALQAKLLRVLQEKEFFRVGGVRQIKSDARVIAATHRPLKEMVKTGAFREDLFFRLNVLTFELAPLSQRPEDIPILIQFFWEKLKADFCRKIELAPETAKLLGQYPFPGNVRELQNVLERLMVLGSDGNAVPACALPSEFHHVASTSGATGPVTSVTPLSLTPEIDSLIGKLSLDAIVESIESQVLDKAMAMAGQSQIRAAEILQLSRGAIQYKLKKYAKDSAA